MNDNTLHQSLIKRDSAEEVVGHRNRALETIRRGLETLEEGVSAYNKAICSQYSRSIGCLTSGRSMAIHDIDRAMKDVQREVDQEVWRYLRDMSGLRDLMSAHDRKQFDDMIERDPPEVTVDNLYATFENLAGETGTLFSRSIVHAFQAIDKTSFKTNDAFKIGEKAIIDYAISEFGRVSHYKADTLRDIERVLHVLDNKTPPKHPAGIVATIEETIRRDPANALVKLTSGNAEDDYFALKWFKNGNLHIRFKRMDLIRLVNQAIADHYGSALGDAT